MMALQEQDDKMEEITKLDQALKKYYESLSDDSYLNDDKKGKFLEFCEENGFDDEDLNEEFKESLADIADSNFVDFDEEFPLAAPTNDKNERIIEIYRIIKYCFEEGKPPRRKLAKKIYPSASTISKLDDDVVTEKEVDDVAEKYKVQTPILFNLIHQEQDILHFLAASRVNDGYPYLINMVDAYNRDRLLMKQSKNINEDTLTVVQWIKTKKHTQNLHHDENINGILAEKLKHGIVGYCHRICPRFQFSPLNKIDDNIADITKYLICCSDLIDKLLNQEKAIPPFQIDLIIAVKSLKTDQITDAPDEYDDDVEDDDMDGRNNYGEKKKDIEDHVGNIHKKLKSENLCYHKETVDHKQMEEVNGLSRFVMDNYQKFRSVLDKNPKKNNQSIKPDNHQPFDGKTFPQRKRFSIFVDRRKDKNDENDNKQNDKKNDDDNDVITFFEQPPICDTIPSGDPVPEWHFESTKRCLIPRQGFGNGGDEKENNIDPTPPNKTITAADAAQGTIMTFSFIVDAEDRIKCYFYWQAQCLRFYPQDIVEAFKFIFTKARFNDFKKNVGNKSEKLIRKIYIRDEQFEQFYKSLEEKKLKFPKTDDFFK